MKVRNGDIWQAKQGLATLTRERWPVRTAFELAKLSQKLGEKVAAIDEVRNKLINEYGETNERGQTTITQSNPRWAEFAPLFNELMEHEEEMEVEPVRLPPDDKVALTPDTLLEVGAFVTLEDKKSA